MAKYRHREEIQKLMIPIDFSQQLVPGTLAFAIDYLIERERIPLNPLDENYRNDGAGRPAYHPKALLKVVLWAYAHGMLSSREIESACKENVVCMALAGFYSPDHSTIARFLLRHLECMNTVFLRVLSVCEEENLLGNSRFALDGIKLPANAAKEWSGTRADFELKRSKLKTKLSELTTIHMEMDKNSLQNDQKSRTIARLDRKLRKIDGWLAEYQDRKSKRGQLLKSNITDPESSKMKTSHGIIQGYNAQAIVDDKHQVIVAADIIPNNTDQDALKPLLEQLQENVKNIQPSAAEFLADTGYFSESNLAYLAAKNIDAYIPDAQFRQRDRRFERRADSALYHRDQFIYSPDSDSYTCPQGQQLLRKDVKKPIAPNTVKYESTYVQCQPCSLRDKCLRSKNSKFRTLLVTIKHGIDYGRQMRDKIDSPQGKRIYSHRLGMIEPVFGNIRHNKGMNRFMHRGRLKVRGAWLLYAMVHNIEKILHYGNCVPKAA